MLVIHKTQKDLGPKEPFSIDELNSKLKDEDITLSVSEPLTEP